MDISVVITTYNRPDALLKVLEGLAHQRRLPEEVIVADDGSGPETARAIQRVKDEVPYGLYHVWQEDKGFRPARIRNKGINTSSGSYIISLDGDCIPGKHFIHDHIELAQKGFFFQGKRMLIGQELSPAFTHREADSLSKLLRYFLRGKISNAHHMIRIPWFPGWTSRSLSGIRSCNMGFFRSDIFAVNGFNQDFVGWGREDSELAVRLYNYGLKRKSHTFRAICYHLWHQQQNRSRLNINDELLQHRIDSGEYFCPKGLVKR